MFLRYNYKAFLWALLILIVCSIPGNDIPDLSSWRIEGLDKIVHLFLFLVLAILLIKGFSQQFFFPVLKNYPFITAFLGSFLYGFLIEILQEAFFTDRSAEVSDIVADVTGAAFGLIYSFLIKLKKRKKMA